jgi:hypothetical protein
MRVIAQNLPPESTTVEKASLVIIIFVYYPVTFLILYLHVN